MKYKIQSYIRLYIAILILGVIAWIGSPLVTPFKIGLGSVGLVTLYSAFGINPLA